MDHDVLLKKLESAGFRGVVLNWFKTYLTDRVQVVKVNSTYSVQGFLKAGVPQGSVLGPILFIIYLNSVFDVNFRSKIVAFADDMAFIYICQNTRDLIRDLNCDLSTLRKWFDLHNMELSEKTKALFYKIKGEQTVTDDLTYHASNCNLTDCYERCIKIETVNTFKYLGIFIDKNLNWKDHISHLNTQLFMILRKFYRIRSLCPYAVLKLFYSAFVDSKLQYGITSWGGCFTNALKSLTVTHKHIVKVMFRKNRMTPSFPLFKMAMFLPLRHLYIYKILKIYFLRSGNRNTNNKQTYNLRQNNLCRIPTFKTENFRRYYLCTAPVFYNALPAVLKSINNINTFLKQLKLWLLLQPDVNWLFDVVV